MDRIKITFGLVLGFFLFSCVKDKTEEISVKGNVRNNCTGLPFKAVAVRFTKPEGTESRETDNEGNFDFGDVEVNGKNNYTYKLGISGYSNPDYEFYGITVGLVKDELKVFHQFGVSASFKLLRFVIYNQQNINPPDSFFLSGSQHTLHYYEPDRIDRFEFSSNGFYNGVGISGYPMGWWHITLEKYKSGIHTAVYDSVYVGIGATETYTIPW